MGVVVAGIMLRICDFFMFLCRGFCVVVGVYYLVVVLLGLRFGLF